MVLRRANKQQDFNRQFNDFESKLFQFKKPWWGEVLRIITCWLGGVLSFLLKLLLSRMLSYPPRYCQTRNFHVSSDHPPGHCKHLFFMHHIRCERAPVGSHLCTQLQRIKYCTGSATPMHAFAKCYVMNRHGCFELWRKPENPWCQQLKVIK